MYYAGIASVLVAILIGDSIINAVMGSHKCYSAQPDKQTNIQTLFLIECYIINAFTAVQWNIHT